VDCSEFELFGLLRIRYNRICFLQRVLLESQYSYSSIMAKAAEDGWQNASGFAVSEGGPRFAKSGDASAV